MSGGALKPGACTPSMSNESLAPLAYMSLRNCTSGIARSLDSVVGEGDDPEAGPVDPVDLEIGLAPLEGVLAGLLDVPPLEALLHPLEAGLFGELEVAVGRLTLAPQEDVDGRRGRLDPAVVDELDRWGRDLGQRGRRSLRGR